MNILNKLHRYIPGYGPEWGSGGIFGLKYHRKTLYFTLAFEAKAHFLTESRETIYDFSLVGSPPRSGGDTYNAVTAIDEKIYFGGWVHAPASYNRERRELSFITKYSHLHAYDISNDEVELLWKEGARQKTTWAGEVSEILYDEMEHRLLIARGDGFRNLGVYSYDLDNRKMSSLTNSAAIKGTIFLDHAIFNQGGLFFNGLQCVDLNSGKVLKIDLDRTEKASRDGAGIENPRILGNIGTTSMNIAVFVKGGIFMGNPLEQREKESAMTFIRLFDFPLSQCSPFRTNCLPVRGGLLTAYNSLPDMLGLKRSVVMPTLLVFVSPPMVKIVGVYGARITSLEKFGSKILVASNTTPNTAKPIAMDSGYREITVLNDDIIDRRPPAYYLTLRGNIVKDKVWGGFPLAGYKNASLKIIASKSNKLTVFEYNTELPVAGEPLITKYHLKEGKNIIDLKGFHCMTSLKFEKTDDQSIILGEFS